jgi:hypothetical protein
MGSFVHIYPYTSLFWTETCSFNHKGSRHDRDKFSNPDFCEICVVLKFRRILNIFLIPQLQLLSGRYFYVIEKGDGQQQCLTWLHVSCCLYNCQWNKYHLPKSKLCMNVVIYSKNCVWSVFTRKEVKAANVNGKEKNLSCSIQVTLVLKM